jgi:hypothetical protein
VRHNFTSVPRQSQFRSGFCFNAVLSGSRQRPGVGTDIGVDVGLLKS